MKIGNITFHGAHNYGSVLQAYALKTFVENLAAEKGTECEYSVLNFRTDFQKALYSRPVFNSPKNALKRLMYLPYQKKLDVQNQKFEAFIAENLNLSEEFSTENELPVLADNCDVLLAGSDQIWNIRARDFSFAYLFENCTPKKVSYATSLGPLEIDWSQYDKERYVNALKQFTCISAREEKSRQMLAQIAPETAVDVLVDPTLLLDVSEWRQIQSQMNVNGGKYILFYCLEPTRDHIRLAKLLSKKTGMPVVATAYRGKKDYFNPFVKQYDAGPRDFLSLIDHASIVLTSSFHGTAFSLIYGKPFYAIDGMKDGRISNILRLSHAERNAIALNAADFENEPQAADIRAWIKEQRKTSQEYLTAALGL